MNKIVWFLSILCLVLFTKMAFYGDSQIKLNDKSLISAKEVEQRLIQAYQVESSPASLVLPHALSLQTHASISALRESTPPFSEFKALLKRSFPKVHAMLDLQTISENSLLYLWKGRNSQLKPALLMAHSDVVPAQSNKNWSAPPFSGQVTEGKALDNTYIVGRGALDDKSSLIAILHAVEQLLEQGLVPERSLYLAFGHDEEIGGRQGAKAIAALLDQQKVKLSTVLDEGYYVLDGVMPGVDAPVAMIGIAEKGFVNLKLSVQQSPGHSSVPPAQTAIGILSQAIHALDQSPMPGAIDGVLAKTFEATAPHMPWYKHLLFANLWLFEPLVAQQLAASPKTNALYRTTHAVTMMQGGNTANVLPEFASAIVNFRIKPGDSIKGVLRHVMDVVDDERVKVERLSGFSSEASSVSEVGGRAYQQLATQIKHFFPEAVVAPAMVVGATDARYYNRIADNTYRFRPLVLTPEDIDRFHGDDEKISVATFLKMRAFYESYIASLVGS